MNTKIITKAKEFLKKSFIIIYSITHKSINNKSVVFKSFSGQYSDNPRAIS